MNLTFCFFGFLLYQQFSVLYHLSLAKNVTLMHD